MCALASQFSRSSGCCKNPPKSPKVALRLTKLQLQEIGKTDLEKEGKHVENAWGKRHNNTAQ